MTRRPRAIACYAFSRKLVLPATQRRAAAQSRTAATSQPASLRRCLQGGRGTSRPASKSPEGGGAGLTWDLINFYVSAKVHAALDGARCGARPRGWEHAPNPSSGGRARWPAGRRAAHAQEGNGLPVYSPWSEHLEVKIKQRFLCGGFKPLQLKPRQICQGHCK